MNLTTYRPSHDLPPVESGSRLELLFYCIGKMVNGTRQPLDRFIKELIADGNGGYCGGDPGWEIDTANENGNALTNSQGILVGRCWAQEKISGISPDTAEYPLAEIYMFTKMALTNLAVDTPELKEEAQSIIEKYFSKPSIDCEHKELKLFYKSKNC
ncbi:hypothetical protein [Amantichitinum ursilacus]|uniref:Uncharacterized protein n=1 Tax=Amantichitinum ursilacus TaxID=857265 RepID=A0A0N0GNU0_9NEIS|nr:hypothetical protein [Amantichitinum ursilacus]KPC53165.1 hypothetical protein WG78_08745 [Amantichitinum ursilacus]